MTFVCIYLTLLSVWFYIYVYRNSIIEKRKYILGTYAFLLLIYSFITYYLSKGWYTSNSVGFHWFDDSGEWLWMDKLGHFYTAAIWSRFAIIIFSFAGVDIKTSREKVVWIGFFLLSSVEWFDGISPAYGASFYDILANFLGCAFIYIQFKYLSKLNFWPKWSYWPNMLASFRPNILGSNMPEQILKNYNGQIYWLSFPVSSFWKSKYIPSWLCVSVGYGAEGMVGGDDNIWSDSNGNTHNLSSIQRYQQVYISLDMLIANKEHYKWWKKVLIRILSAVKFPFPAIEINIYNGITFHWIAI
jgi:hypothetical protein